MSWQDRTKVVMLPHFGEQVVTADAPTYFAPEKRGSENQHNYALRCRSAEAAYLAKLLKEKKLWVKKTTRYPAV